MWRQAGFEEMLVSPARTRSKRDGGDSKNEIGFDVHHIYDHIDVKVWKTRPIMVEKCQNLRNEIETRWGDSANFFIGATEQIKTVALCVSFCLVK